MSDENNNRWWKPWLKALGILAVICLVLIVVGFGLLVGFCGLLGRR